jgi:hypothetical protein
MSRARRCCAALRCRFIELGEVYDSTGAGRERRRRSLKLLAQFEGADKRRSAQVHASPRLARLGSRSRSEYV